LWIEQCRAHDAEQSLREWEAGLRVGAVSLNEYRRYVLNLPESPEFEVMLTPASMIEHDQLNP